MGQVYLPTWIACFYGTLVGNRYTSPMDCLGLEERDWMGGRVLDESDETMQFKGQMGYKRKLICWAYSSKTGRYWAVYFLQGVWCWKLILPKHAEICLNMRIESHVDTYSLVECSINSLICIISWMHWCKLPLILSELVPHIKYTKSTKSTHAYIYIYS